MWPNDPFGLITLQAEDDSPLLKEEPHVEFTGEEGLGRFLDLHDLYLRFLNLRNQQQRSKGGKTGGKAAGEGDLVEVPEEEAVAEKSFEYYEYLTSFSDLSGVPRKQKMGKQYRWDLLIRSDKRRGTTSCKSRAASTKRDAIHQGRGMRCASNSSAPSQRGWGSREPHLT
jgi:hypothetical protein